MRKAGGVKVRSWKGTEGEGGAQVLPQCIWGVGVGWMGVIGGCTYTWVHHN